MLTQAAGERKHRVITAGAATITLAFTVLLDPDGSRRYRSWTIEHEPAEPPTQELKLLPSQD